MERLVSQQELLRFMLLCCQFFLVLTLSRLDIGRVSCAVLEHRGVDNADEDSV